MKFLLFALPLTATERLFAQDGSSATVWSVANKLWCSGPRPDASYSEFITKRCCNEVRNYASITGDGFCTGQDTHGDGWFHDFDWCCGGHTALTTAYCINGLCPSKTMNIGGMSHAVNGTSKSNPESPKPSSDKEAKPSDIKDSPTTKSTPTQSSSDSNTTTTVSVSETTANSSATSPDSKATPTTKALHSATGSTTTTSSSTNLTPSNLFAIIIALIAIGN